MAEKRSFWKDTEWKQLEPDEVPVEKRSKKDITEDALKVISGEINKEDADEEVLDAAHKILVGKWF